MNESRVGILRRYLFEDSTLPYPSFKFYAIFQVTVFTVIVVRMNTEEKKAKVVYYSDLRHSPQLDV